MVRALRKASRCSLVSGHWALQVMALGTKNTRTPRILDFCTGFSSSYIEDCRNFSLAYGTIIIEQPLIRLVSYFRTHTWAQKTPTVKHNHDTPAINLTLNSVQTHSKQNENPEALNPNPNPQTAKLQNPVVDR